jgi:hypothetical protein
MSEPLSRALRLPAVLGAVWVACCLVAPGAARAESAAEHFAHRHRALDANERALALEIARDRAEAELRRRAGRAPGAPERLEFLDVDLHRHAKDTRASAYRRRADVYAYDYDTDQLAWAVVDLDSNRVESLNVTPSVQRPLSDREVAHALDLVFADAASAARIRSEFVRIAGHPLGGRGDLEVAGFVYRADSMPNSNSADSAACGRHRCAQLLVRTHDEVSLELPIVDLSRERVLESRWFGPPPPAAPAPDADDHDHAKAKAPGDAKKPAAAAAKPAATAPAHSEPRSAPKTTPKPPAAGAR